MIAFSVGIGVASGSQPIIGFNYGAQKYDRVKKTFLLSAGVCTIITCVAWVIFQCFPLQLIRIFGTESSLYEEFAVQCFRIYLLLTFLNGVQMCAGVLFQAIGQPVKAAVASLSKQLLFYIPAMLILSRIWGLTGILMAGPTADALAFIRSFVLKKLRRWRRQDWRRLQRKPSPVDTIYFAQAKIIKNLAEKESCVIVGRCSDYILRDTQTFHVI